MKGVINYFDVATHRRSISVLAASHVIWSSDFLVLRDKTKEQFVGVIGVHVINIVYENVLTFSLLPHIAHALYNTDTTETTEFIGVYFGGAHLTFFVMLFYSILE